MLRALVLLVVLCSACSLQFDLASAAPPSATPDVVVTDPALADAVSEAASDWNAGTQGAAAPTVRLAAECPAGAWCVISVPAANLPRVCNNADAVACTLMSDTMHTGPLAVRVSEPTRIYISDAIAPYELASTIMHEFGHAWGLEHAPTGLMNPTRPTAERRNPQIDAATLAAYSAVQSAVR